MDKKKFNCPESFGMFEPVEYGKGDSVPIDQTGSQLFNIDPATGRPMVDFTRLLKSQDELTKNALLKQLSTSDASYLPKDISDEEVIKYSVPRLAQLPSELAEHAESLTKMKIEEAKKKQINDAIKKSREERMNRSKSLEDE